MAWMKYVGAQNELLIRLWYVTLLNHENNNNNDDDGDSNNKYEVEEVIAQ